MHVELTAQEIYDARNAVRTAILARQHAEKSWDRYAALMGTLDIAWIALTEDQRSALVRPE